MSLIRLALGLALMPAAFSALLAAARTMGGVASHPGTALWFVVGFFAYPLVHFLLFKPLRLYVLGHELSHAIAGWMSGAAVRGIKVGSDGGHVDLSRSNLFVALAPYVAPLYALAVVAGYRLLLWHAQWAAKPPPRAQEGFLLAMGAALSFHLIFTGEALWVVDQPDLRQAGGRVFSWALIGLGNGLVLIVALKCLFPRRVSVLESARLVWDFTLRFWKGILALLDAGYLIVKEAHLKR